MTTVRAKKAVTINYQNGKIYKIVNDVNDMIYIGSTTTTLSRRLSGHKQKAKTPKLRANLHVHMDLIAIEHFQIILIDLFPCTCKAELESREYEITHTFERARLYNSRFEENGKSCHSQETLAKMRANNSQRGKFQEQSTTFKRGSISISETRCYIHFTYQNEVTHKRVAKSFRFAKIRSREMAYLMAVEAQNSIFPFTHKEYQSQLPFYEV